MSISILNRGASGGLKPELTVTAPSGSTVDLLQNGIIVATHTLGANETEHTFIVKVGTYIVRGTLGANTAETNVAIDVVGQYRVSVSYELCIFDYQNGGMQVNYAYNGSSGYPITVTSEYIVGTQSWSGGAWTACYVTDEINVSNYKYVYAEIKAQSELREFWIMGAYVLPAPASSNYIGIYADNVLSKTGGSDGLFGCKMPSDYIRLIKFTNSVPSDAIFWS